jgi:hypothetical protein
MRFIQNKQSLFLCLRFVVCILTAGITLYAYIDKQNELIELRLALPVLAKAVKNIQDENQRLQYEIDRFESPIHLMELAGKPEFGHLKYPYIKDMVFLLKGDFQLIQTSVGPVISTPSLFSPPSVDFVERLYQ